MKKLKLLTSICLIVAMLVSACPMALAASVSELGVNWIFNPVKSLEGYIYSSSPYGFIIDNTLNGSRNFLTEKGLVITGEGKDFTEVSNDGLIAYYDEVKGGMGVKDYKGNTIIAVGKYDKLYTMVGNLICYGVNSDDGSTLYGAIDKNGKEIIPAKYDGMNWWGMISCYTDDETYVYDYSGKKIATYDSKDNIDVQLLPSTDRYLTVNYTYTGTSTETVTRIKSIDGTTIAKFPCSVHIESNKELRTHEEKKEDNGYALYVYYYDYNGKLLRTDVQRGGSFGLPFTYKYISDNSPKYTIDENDNRNVVDKKGNVIYRAPRDYHVSAIYKDTYVKICNTKIWKYSLVDLNGNEIVPCVYDNIRYSEGLDICAFEKDEKISIGKIRPVKVSVNGKNVSFDQNPVVKDGRTLVPLRAILEALGATVNWDGATQTVRSSLGSTNIKLVVGSKDMKVNDKIIKIDVPAEIINGRTMVPARAISEAFNCSVKWDETNRTVIIKK